MTRVSVVVLVVEQEKAHRWVVRRSGLLAGCSSSTVPNSAGWGIYDSHERALRNRLGTPASTGRKTTGHGSGRTPMWISPPLRSAPGARRVIASSPRRRCRLLGDAWPWPTLPHSLYGGVGGLGEGPVSAAQSSGHELRRTKDSRDEQPTPFEVHGSGDYLTAPRPTSRWVRYWCPDGSRTSKRDAS